MPLPKIQPSGVMPAGRHSTTLAEIRKTFVDAAPARGDLRRRTFVALTLWMEQAKTWLGPGEAWLGGSFVTHLSGNPDLRVAYFASTPSMAARAQTGGPGTSLLTLADIFWAEPSPGGHLTELKTVGGLMDAYLADRCDEDAWDSLWSTLWNRTVRTSTTPVGFVTLRVGS